MPRTPHPRMSIAVGTAVALLVLSACAEEEPAEEAATAAAEAPATPSASASESPEVERADPDDYRRGDIPEEAHEYDDSELPDPPFNPMIAPIDGEPATDAERLAHRALRAVTRFAGHVDPDADYHCPEFATEVGTEVDCDVTFLGEEFTYSVEIVAPSLPFADVGGDRSFPAGWTDANVFERTSLPEGPVLREVAEADMRHEYDTEYTVCDMDELVRAEENEPTGIRCSAIDPETGAAIDAELRVLSTGSFRWDED